MMKPGLVSITLRKHSPVEIVDLCVRAGLKGIEWGGDVHVPHGDLRRAREVAAATRGAGLAVSSYGSYYRPESDKSPAWNEVLQTAILLGAPVIRAWAGPRASDQVDEKERIKIVDDLRRCAESARAANVRLALEYHANTLTDTNESAQRLARELEGSGALFYWQPPNRMPHGEALAGLQALADNVCALHVFSWATSGDGIERLPLEAGEDRWREYLPEATRADWALLEFVKDDDPEQVVRDARCLRSWLEE